MASGPITSWQTEVEKCKQWKILFSWAPKITVDSDCSHGIKRHLLLRRKAMTNLDSILKSRDITLPTKVRIVKTMVYSSSHVQIWLLYHICMVYTIQMVDHREKVEHQRIDGFELWCWKRLFRVPWTARRSNQSILKEINSEYSLEGLILKLKLQYFGHLMQRAHSLEKNLMLGKTKGNRRRGLQRMRWLDSITYSMDMSLSKL